MHDNHSFVFYLKNKSEILCIKFIFFYISKNKSEFFYKIFSLSTKTNLNISYKIHCFYIYKNRFEFSYKTSSFIYKNISGFFL